ncbi:MAG: hypothetical protein K8R54_16980 [Bacteroidales bacterium]|nr:hypothetical protein [Bacteroidales bacterium]
MHTYSIINEIQKLSISEQMYIAETIIKSMRKSENNNQMLFAAEELYNEYKTNKELTIFTNIDFDNFYETAK